MPTLTVFTPTYNRAHTLGRTYESLCRQTCRDFEWLIIDDGSTDNTRELVQTWVEEKRLLIRYIYKENGGLHTGYNTAFANIDSEINVCVDSDDYMPSDAVAVIIKTWVDKCRCSPQICGIIGLDFNINGEPLGGQFKKTGVMHFYDIHTYHKADVKIVARTSTIKRLPPMKSFDGEKNYNPGYFYYALDCDYTYYVINENLCFVDYQQDGMSNAIFYQYRNSPKSFAEARRFVMQLPYYDTKQKFRNAIHYVSSCLFAKEWNMIKTSPKPLLTIFAIPFGIALNIYIRYKTNHK